MKQSLVLLSLILSCYCQGQSSAPLFAKLKSAKSDTALINAYNDLTEFHIQVNNDSAAWYNKRSLALSGQKQKDAFNFRGYFLNTELERINKHYPEALISAQKARQIAIQSKNVAHQVDAINASGNIFMDVKQGNESLANYLDAYNLSKSKNYRKGLMNSATNLGIYYKADNDITNSLLYFLKVYPLTEELKDTSAFFNCCINLGSLYERTNDHVKALQLYKKALAVSLVNTIDINAWAICYFKIGKVFSFLNQLDSAEYYLDKTMKIHLERNDEIGLIFDYSFLGLMYLNEGEYAKAEAKYNTSLELALKHNDSIRISSVHNSMAFMYVQKKDYLNAIKNFNDCLKYCPKKTPSETLMKVYTNIAASYKKQGMYKEAYENSVMAKAWSDSTHNIKETKKQTEMKLGFEFNQVQEKLKAEADAKELINAGERERDRQQRNYLLGGLALISLFLVIAIRSYRAKQKANQVLGRQKKQIENQKKVVEMKNREISDSINYAKRIQNSCLPEEHELKKYFPDYAMFFRPKDVVSGDFFWAAQSGDKVLIAVADCTGHGVPGAITSMIGSILLNEIFYVKKMQIPGEVLAELNRLVKVTLKQQAESLTRDGMDMAFCMWDKSTNQLHYAGANRPVYIVRPGTEVVEHKPTKQSIGGYTSSVVSYEVHTIQLQKGDTVVLTSDGYPDQFGGEKEKKFTTRAFRAMLAELAGLSSGEQEKLVEQRFEKWKGTFDQTDDVLVFTFNV